MIVRDKLLKKLDSWWNSQKNTALLLTGLPGVGKTALLSFWASKKGIKIIKVDNDLYIKEINKIFNIVRNDTNIAINLLNKINEEFDENSIILFDNILPNSEIFSFIREICSKSKLRIVFESRYGKLTIDNLRFNPVGFITTINIKPLTFLEYCEYKGNKLLIDSAIDSILNKENVEINFYDRFEEFWETYITYGGFPCVLEALQYEGNISAKSKLIDLVNKIYKFISTFPYSSSLLSLLDKYSSDRSSCYRKFQFSLIGINGTYNRLRRPITILKNIDLFGIMTIKGEKMSSSYYDIFLCDPGLENAFCNFNCSRNHVIESILFFNGTKMGYNPYRFVIKDRAMIDMVYGGPIPYAIEIKSISSNLENSLFQLKHFENWYSSTCKPYILIDKNFNKTLRVERAWLLPIWAFLIV